jgi:hypothetical protein
LPSGLSIFFCMMHEGISRMEVELVKLKVPDLREAECETAIIEWYRRHESSVKETLMRMYVYLNGIGLKRIWGGEVRNISVFVAEDGFAKKTTKPHFCYQKPQLSCSKMGLLKKLSIFSIFCLTVLKISINWCLRNAVREVMEKSASLFDFQPSGTCVMPLWRQQLYCVGLFLKGDL